MIGDPLNDEYFFEDYDNFVSQNSHLLSDELVKDFWGTVDPEEPSPEEQSRRSSRQSSQSSSLPDSPLLYSPDCPAKIESFVTPSELDLAVANLDNYSEPTSTEEIPMMAQIPDQVQCEVSAQGYGSVNLSAFLGRKPEKAVSEADIALLEEQLAAANPSKKNAIQAKLNREKKKYYIQKLEMDVVATRERNSKLELSNQELVSRNNLLEDEVSYLKSALANAPGLGEVLKTITNVKDVKLSTSFFKRKSVSLDHGSYHAKRLKCHTTEANNNTDNLGGVCLHVKGNTASLELCAACSKMGAASQEFDSA